MTQLKFSGYCLILGGVLLFLGNAIFSPMLPVDGETSDIMASTAFARRLGTNALTVFLLMIGTTGIFKYQSHQSGVFGAIAFAMAFAGSAFMFAHEWGQVFYMHSFAITEPQALNAMDAANPVPLLIEVGLALGFFAIGWILFCVSILTAKVLPKTGPILVLSGFAAIPVFSAILSDPIWGGVGGSVILGAGLAHMGRTISR